MEEERRAPGSHEEKLAGRTGPPRLNARLLQSTNANLSNVFAPDRPPLHLHFHGLTPRFTTLYTYQSVLFNTITHSALGYTYQSTAKRRPLPLHHGRWPAAPLLLVRSFIPPSF